MSFIYSLLQNFMCQQNSESAGCYRLSVCIGRIAGFCSKLFLLIPLLSLILIEYLTAWHIYVNTCLSVQPIARYNNLYGIFLFCFVWVTAEWNNLAIMNLHVTPAVSQVSFLSSRRRWPPCLTVAYGRSHPLTSQTSSAERRTSLQYLLPGFQQWQYEGVLWR